jgi:pilus assembly protein CpaC
LVFSVSSFPLFRQNFSSIHEEENAMWQTIAIALFLHGVNAALSEGPTVYYAAPAAQQAPRPLVAAVQPRASVKAGAEPSRPVVLRLSVYEVSLTKLRRMGFEGAKVSGDAVEPFDMDKLLAALEGNNLKVGGKVVQAGQGTIGLGVMDEQDELNESIKALSKEGLVKVLAAPTLMTMSGQAASFHAGGEIAVPVPDGKGNTSVEYKRFGTMVDFVPVIMKNERIRLELRAEVTELDREHSVVIAGQPVPGLRSRTVNTACEMKSGQVLVLSGLHERQPGETAGDAGKEKTKKSRIEQSKTKSAMEETVLLFTVKAEIVEPMDGRGKMETAKRAGGGGTFKR